MSKLYRGILDGEKSIRWDAAMVKSCVYFVKLTAAGYGSVTRKVVVIK